TMSARTVLEVNVEGTRSVLESAAASGCKVVFASTSDVYGKWRGSPFKETDDLLLGPPTVSRWAYAASKIYDEHLCLAYGREVGIPTVIIRVFNTYGPRNDTTLVS